MKTVTWEHSPAAAERQRHTQGICILKHLLTSISGSLPTRDPIRSNFLASMDGGAM